MMALQMLLLLQVLVVLSFTSAYPVYGTKRYGGGVQKVAPYQMVRYPPNYYDLYPYSQTYPDDYYPQESYPVYYPPARTSKYEVYQAVLPYYYGERPLAHPGYYYDTDPVEDLQEEIMQEVEREEREDSQPIGHEMLYENQDQSDNFDDVNAAFLQNLIMTQMYKDALQKDPYYYEDPEDYLPEDYGKWERSNKKPHYNSRQEDQDVKELKQLMKPSSKNNKAKDEIHWFQRSNFRNQKEHQSKNNYAEKRNIKLPTSTIPPVPESSTQRAFAGQKEEMLMRPATPIRHPFSSPILEMLSKEDEKKRTPSVYDTIKHMLDMEKSLEKEQENSVRPNNMKKRIISSEDSLIHQLSVLKKAH